MDLKNLHFLICASLKKEYEIEEAQELAWRVIEHVSGQHRNRLKLENKSFEFMPALNHIIERLNKGEPLQYVLGYEWWGGMQVKVNRQVLIPRPETEELTRKLVAEIKNGKSENVKIIDIGTGSGCICLLLKKELPAAAVIGCDISREALHIAKENSEQMHLDIQWLHYDISQSNAQFPIIEFDYIISNPPYITVEEKRNMHERVFLHEPSLALFVKESDALFFYKKIIVFADRYLKLGGTIYMEINNKYDKETMTCFEKNGYDTKLENDMYGNARFLIAKKPL